MTLDPSCIRRLIATTTAVATAVIVIVSLALPAQTLAQRPRLACSPPSGAPSSGRTRACPRSAHKAKSRVRHPAKRRHAKHVLLNAKAKRPEGAQTALACQAGAEAGEGAPCLAEGAEVSCEESSALGCESETGANLVSSAPACAGGDETVEASEPSPACEAGPETECAVSAGAMPSGGGSPPRCEVPTDEETSD
ncbi:MAG: hypothetical protein ABSG95_08795 [Solirubrobacteraceae bacterium]